jgi:type IV pilus assembly protein PilA
MRKNRKEQGFSLIELLVVVGIILIIATIAIPNLLAATWSARQAKAAGFITAISQANSLYEQKWQDGYAPTIGVLAGPATAAATCDLAEVLDNSLPATMTNSGQYLITYTATGTTLTAAAAGCTNPGQAGFLATANPLTAGAANAYCIDEKQTLHVDTTGPTAAVTTDAACDALPVQ